MPREPVARTTNARREMRGHRTRAAQLPNCQVPNLIPLWLFTIDDVRRLSTDAAKRNPALQVRQQSDAELTHVAHLLRLAFQWAVQCDKMQEWELEPQRKGRFYEQVARYADGLLRALALNPEEYRAPANAWTRRSVPLAIREFRHSLDRMVGACPELPDQLGALSRVAWDEGGSNFEGSDSDVNGGCQYRERASFLVDRFPRTVALVSMLACWQLEQLDWRPRGNANQSDLLGRELFELLAGAHEATYESKPLTRIKSGETIGGSIDWARAVIRHAANAIERSSPAVLHAEEDSDDPPPQAAKFLSQAQRIAAHYTARFSELADQSDRRVGDLLDRGWRDWKLQVRSAR